MKVVRKYERKYYKYGLEEFTMPIFASNKGWGTVSNSENSDNAYYIFDNPSSGGNRYSKYTSGGRIPIDWYWDCPDYLQLTSVYYWGQTYSNASYATNSLTIYGWDYEANDWKQLGYQANSWESDYNNYDVACEKLLTNKFKFTVVFKNIDNHFPSTLTELVPKGYKRVGIKGTINDYDYYRDELVHKLTKKIVRKYYKYVDTKFVQPVLTSNGTLGVDDIACYTNYASNWSEIYKIFSTSNEVCNAMGSPFANMEWILYSKNALCIKRFYGTFLNCTTLQLYGSNDNVNYTQIPFTYLGATQSSFDYSINNTQYFHYYKWLSGGQAYVSSVSTCPYSTKMKIDATQRIVHQTTQDDYDYYVDLPIFYAINQ